MHPVIHLIWFSPTQTTRKIVEAIAAGIGGNEQRHYDLTRRQGGLDLELEVGLAIFGFPVYAGRVPEVFLERIERLSAAGVPAVLVALYGNREYEDALVELRDVVAGKGFSVVAAGTFIGEHSYSTDAQPVAPGRPDAADLEAAREFGGAIGEQWRAGFSKSPPRIPGNWPYRERAPLGGIAPETDRERCTLCGACAEVCPTFVITVANQVSTQAQGCVMCCACVRRCPEDARAMDHPMVAERRRLLLEHCGWRKEPEMFLCKGEIKKY